MATDLFGTPGYLGELRGFAIVVKLLMVASVAVLWPHRVAILFAVIILSGVVSHGPGKGFRYLRVIPRRKDPS